MRSGAVSRVLCGAFLTIIVALPNKPSAAANCALYVRAETGVALYGAAGGWWNQAEGLYARGHLPAVGAILVFRPTRHMRSGHVALVARIVNEREILVDHANWYHGTVSRGMPVIDTSPANDWTSVAVLEVRSGTYGRDNPAFGFIYPLAPTDLQPEFVQAAAITESADPDTPVARPMRFRKAHRNR
jgi:hypothetical protein